MAKKFEKDDIDHFYDYGIYAPSRTLYMGSEGEDVDGGEAGVDFLMAERIIKGLHILDTMAPAGDKPITIIMNNPGGYVDHGMAIYDAIKACNNHVTIIVRGNACSMGGYILQAADERIMSPHSTFMFHAGYDGHSSNHPEIIKRWVAYNEKMSKVLNKILLDRINEKRAKGGEDLMSKKQFERLNLFDTILTSQEAVEWGLADKVQ